MPLLSITYFNQLFQTLSAFDVALLTLTTSFVSQLYFHTSRSRLVLQVSSLCFRHFEPRSNLPLFILLILVPSFLSTPISYHVRYAFASVQSDFASYIRFLLFFTIAYRLVTVSPLHPLAKYPGPTIVKTSKWWATYARGRGNLYTPSGGNFEAVSPSARHGGGPHPGISGSNMVCVPSVSLFHVR